jgi:cytochrome c
MCFVHTNYNEEGKKMAKKILLVVCTIFFMAGLAQAADRVNAQDAQALLKKAVAYLKTNGDKKTFAEAMSPTSTLKVKDDGYIIIWNMKGFALAHPNPSLANKDFWNLKDADGKLFIQESVHMAEKSNTGYLEYKWTDPLLKKPALRGVYFERVGDLIVLSGFFK